MARHGSTKLAPEPADPTFPDYKQFLLLGEAGLATAIYYVFGARHIAPADQRRNWTAGQALRAFESRLRLVTRQLARFPHMAGENFTAADISVAYALMLVRRGDCATLGAAEEDYMIRVTGRDAFKRALETCQATKEGYKGFG